MSKWMTLWVAVLAVWPVQAQTLQWERVGTRGAYCSSRPAWGTDGLLIAACRYGLEVLPPPHDSLTDWQVRNELFTGMHILVLSEDTLVASRGNELYRSVDGGFTFTSTRIVLASRPAAIPYGLPFGGRVVVQSTPSGASSRFAVVSHDRGATWTEGVLPGHPEEYPRGRDIVVMPTGPRAGRVVVAGTWGLATSDDGGDTWAAVPDWWVVYRYQADAVSVVHGAAAGGGDRLVASINDTQTNAVRVVVSDDGGDTWRESAQLPGDPNLFASAFLDLGGGSVVATMLGGHIWESADGGETWHRRAEVVPGSQMDDGPGSAQTGRVTWALLGPDRRIYVGGIALGRNLPTLGEGEILRSAEPYVVADEGTPSAPLGVSLSVTPNPSRRLVTLSLSSREAQRARVVVTDVTGREVWAGEAWATPEGASVSVDASSWASGVYVARASVGRHTEHVTARFTVAR